MTDINTIFCTAQAVFSAQTTVDSTDWLDMKAVADFGAGKPVDVDIIVTSSFVGPGASMRFQLCACEADGTNLVEIASTAAIPIAELTAPSAGVPGQNGSRITLRVPPAHQLPAISGADPRQGLRLRSLTVGANTTQGSITAHLSCDTGSSRPNKAYAGT